MAFVLQETITVPLTAKPLYAVCRPVFHITPATLERSCTKPPIVDNDSCILTPRNNCAVAESTRVTRTAVRARSDDYLIDMLTTENAEIRELIEQQRSLTEIAALLESIDDYDELELVSLLEERHVELLQLKIHLLDRLRASGKLGLQNCILQ